MASPTIFNVVNDQNEIISQLFIGLHADFAGGGLVMPYLGEALASAFTPSPDQQDNSKSRISLDAIAALTSAVPDCGDITFSRAQFPELIDSYIKSLEHPVYADRHSQHEIQNRIEQAELVKSIFEEIIEIKGPSKSERTPAAPKQGHDPR